MQFWIDRGGTFTDCVAFEPMTGKLTVTKVLSSDHALTEGIRRLLGLKHAESIPPVQVRMGTTLATNALLERRGMPVGFLTTRGFDDLLLVRDQARPRLFDLDIRLPPPLAMATRSVASRATPSGRVAEHATPGEVAEALRLLRSAGARSLAVCFVQGHRAGSLERAVLEQAPALGFEHVSLSHEVDNETGFLARSFTTVADAYLTPVIAAYLRELERALPGSSLHVMQSSGGLIDAKQFRGRNAVLSGPAGGVVACAHVAKQAGFDRAIGFDMGGTSTDVCRWDGKFDRVYETEIASIRLRTPMLAVHTVAAGGGSLCRAVAGSLRVGPESAGASPGPLCYGHPDARDLTLTDVNLALGRLRSERFPFPLKNARVNQLLGPLATDVHMSPEHLAEGFLTVANETMAAAIRRVTVERGRDARDYALVVFGGAGGQHACAVARRLGIRTLLFHPLAGVLSAFGMGVASESSHGERDLNALPVDDRFMATAERTFADLESCGGKALQRIFPGGEIRHERRIDVRYVGTEIALTVPIGQKSDVRAAFEAEHERQFGYRRPERAVEAMVARVESIRPGARIAVAAPAQENIPATPAQGRVFLGGSWREVALYAREHVPLRLAGPALVLEATGTLVLEDGFVLERRGDEILVARDERGITHEAPSIARDPIRLEVFSHLFRSVAEEMGEVLRRSAVSTNMRDRLDFSCAVFDALGGLVANAPHIPVHLGAMGESVRAVLSAHPGAQPGDVFATNDPYGGGSHLPDITVVSPVHDDCGELLFWVASRGHHADVGGITPGSMPAFSTKLEEEGVVLRAERILAAGQFLDTHVQKLLRTSRCPARRPEDNVADLLAQVAANRRGAGTLLELAKRYGAATMRAYMQHVQDHAAQCVLAAIKRLPQGEHRFADALDDGTPIVVTVEVVKDALEISFAGSGDAHTGNLNAPRAVTMAAVLYVLRCLADEDIPLNEGCLRHVRVHIPEGSVLSPPPGRAVAGGNVETSQRVVDVLLGALGLAAASQGTMNNLSFGTADLAYYETLGGGAGAGPGFDGASAIHTHMTNSRATDVEVLESRYPVCVREFGVRRGSGGQGAHRGGDGLVREIEFLAPMHVSVLSERRARAPFGLFGGEPGRAGENRLNNQAIAGKGTFEVKPGDRLRIETPGGGGYGSKDRR